MAPFASAGTSLLTVLYNNYASSNVKAYVTGRDPGSGQLLMLDQNNALFDPCTPRSAEPSIQNISAATIAHHLGAQNSWTELYLPSMVSGRIYIVADGDLDFATTSPAAGGTCGFQQSAIANPDSSGYSSNWGFMEVEAVPGSYFVNPSQVDFVGVPLSVRLDTPDGVQEAKGLPSNAVDLICGDLAAEAKGEAGVPWSKLCKTRKDGSYLRVLSPNLFVEADMPIMDTYWDGHVDKVWNTYSNQPLHINTTDFGTVQCQVQGDALVCGTESFQKPTSSDIFSCSTGPFSNGGTALRLAVAPRLCAALMRSTLLLPEGNKQPYPHIEHFYSTTPTNHYAAAVHRHAIDGRGYAFPYDDVPAKGRQDVSGTCAHAKAKKLSVGVGGPLPPV